MHFLTNGADLGLHVLKAFAVKCQSTPSINPWLTLNKHLVQYWVNTRLTLDRHFDRQLVEYWISAEYWMTHVYLSTNHGEPAKVGWLVPDWNWVVDRVVSKMSVKCQSSVSKVLIKMSIKGIDYHFKMDDPRSEWEGSPCYVVDSEQHITTNHLTFRGLAVTLIYLMQDHVTCSKYPIKPSFVNFF